MKISKIAVIFVILAIALTGIHCKKSESPTEPEDINFDGTWVANANTPGTKMIYDASETNPVLIVDVVPDPFFATIAITVSGAKYSLILVQPGDDPIADTGAFVVEGKTITLTSDDPEEDVLIFDFTLDGSMLTLETDNVFFPQTETPAKLTLVLKKVN